MLINPFTPSEIVSEEEDFFGRSAELQSLERALDQGSVAFKARSGLGNLPYFLEHSPSWRVSVSLTQQSR